MRCSETNLAWPNVWLSCFLLEGGGLTKIFTDFLFWESLNFLNGPLPNSLLLSPLYAVDYNNPFQTELAELRFFYLYFTFVPCHLLCPFITFHMTGKDLWIQHSARQASSVLTDVILFTFYIFIITFCIFILLFKCTETRTLVDLRQEVGHCTVFCNVMKENNCALWDC